MNTLKVNKEVINEIANNHFVNGWVLKIEIVESNLIEISFKCAQRKPHKLSPEPLSKVDRPGLELIEWLSDKEIKITHIPDNRKMQPVLKKMQPSFCKLSRELTSQDC